jgi:predicted ester cyclase
MSAGLLLAMLLVMPARAATSPAPFDVVSGFLRDVRSGRDPDAAARYFATTVQAHQVTSEGETTVARTPADYAAHVRDFVAAYGPYQLKVEEILASGNKVFVRWRQTGRHLRSLHGEQPTGQLLTEITSVVYRVESGRIREYWLQTDRKGFDIQLERLGTAKSRHVSN